MGVWKLKGCPRCGGDLFLDKDEYRRWYEQCLQCGYTNELRDVAELDEHSGEREKKSVMAEATKKTRQPQSRESIT